MDLSTQASVYLEAFQDDMRRNFHLIPNAEYGDRRFPLYGVMQIEETATLLQRNGKSAISYEFCYFDVCDQLDADAVAYYCGILEDMAARYVPWTERSHSFSMLSMVVLVNGAPDKALVKQIRKYKHEDKKKKPEKFLLIRGISTEQSKRQRMLCLIRLMRYCLRRLVQSLIYKL